MWPKFEELIKKLSTAVLSVVHGTILKVCAYHCIAYRLIKNVDSILINAFSTDSAHILCS